MCEEKKLPKQKKELSFFAIFVISFVCIVCIRTFAFDVYRVDGQSMEPTFEDGDMIFVKKFGLQNVKRGDIVVCQLDIEPLTQRLVKRVIGVPGDHVCMDESGQIWINGSLSADEFQTEVNKDVHDVFDIHLGDDEYYVLGDNRSHSSDSRNFGPFHESAIKAVYLDWSWKVFRMPIIL